MRGRWSRALSVVVVAATVGTGAAAFQIDADVVTQVANAARGIWIPVETEGEIVQIDGVSGQVTGRVAVADPGSSLVVQEVRSGIVVVDRSAGRVSLVDPALREVMRSVAVTAADPDLVDIGPGATVVARDRRVEVVDLEVTTSTGVDLDGPVGSVAARGGGGVAATADSIAEFDLAGPGADVETGADPVTLVRVGDEVLVVDGEEIRTRAGETRGCLNRAISEEARLTGHESGWVAIADTGMIQVADLVVGWCRVFTVDEEESVLGRPAIAGGSVFVPDSAQGAVHIVDPISRRSEVHRVIGTQDLRVRSRGDLAVAFSSDSPFASVLDADGVEHFVDTSEEGRTLQAVVDDEASAAVLGADETAAGVGLDSVAGSRNLDGTPILDAAVITATITEPVDPTPEPTVAETDELVANFALSATTVAVDEPVRFVDESLGSPESWVWDFGDGSGAEGPEVEHAWAEPGTYSVTLHVERGEDESEITVAIAVVAAQTLRPPAADFTFSTAVVRVGDEVFFEDRSTGEITRWRWDFGDGGAATTRNPSKSWDQPGRYIVRLTVANDQGSDSAAVVIQVVPDLRAPVAVIEASTTSVQVGAPVSFTGSSATDPASFVWDFGDGAGSTGPEVTHVFLTAGTFTVTLRADNDAGSSTATTEVTVEPVTLPPVARIAAPPELIEVGDVVTLSSLSTNGPETESWSFGDGSTAEGAVVEHTWTAPGAYLVTLVAANEAGTDTAIAIVDVVAELPAPVAVIGDFDPSPWVGDNTVFFDASLDATEWLWDFGDGVTSTARDPLHTFSSAGLKVVTLTVSNRNGSDVASVTVEPRLRPVADFSVSNTAPRVGELVAFTDLSVNAAEWLWDFGDGATSTVRNPQHAYAAAGTYQARLTVTSATGDQVGSAPVQIDVDPAPPRMGSLTVDTDPATTLQRVVFTGVVDPASGPIDAYLIDFGDGSAPAEATDPVFGHTYSAAGTYTASMRARGPLGDVSEAVTLQIGVVDPPPPLIAIAASVPSSAVVGPVTLTGEQRAGSGPIDSWSWSISGGGLGSPVTLSGREVVFDFASPGVYQLALTAQGPVARTTVSQPITITVPPAPEITSLVANPDPATTGQLVEFVPTVSGTVDTWEWDYEGGGFVPGSPRGAHIFNSPGSYTVRLRVTGPYGGTDLESVTVTVFAPPDPVAPQQTPAGTLTTGDTANFVSYEADGDPVVRWDWNVKKGPDEIAYPDHGPSLDHRFESAGNWKVTVTAHGPSGAVGSSHIFVTVVDPVPPLVAGFTHVVGAAMGVSFTDTSTGPPIDSWQWDFGDGLGSSTAQNPGYTYAAPGTYTVTLTVTAGAQVDSVSLPVVIP